MIQTLSPYQREIVAQILNPEVVNSDTRFKKIFGLLDSALNALSKSSFCIANAIILEGVEELGKICLHYTNYKLDENPSQLHLKRFKAASAIFVIPQLIKGDVCYDKVIKSFNNIINFLNYHKKNDDLILIKKSFITFQKIDKNKLDETCMSCTLVYIYSYLASSLLSLMKYYKYDSYRDYLENDSLIRQSNKIISLQHFENFQNLCVITYNLVTRFDNVLFKSFKNFVEASQSIDDWQRLITR